MAGDALVQHQRQPHQDDSMICGFPRCHPLQGHPPCAPLRRIARKTEKVATRESTPAVVTRTSAPYVAESPPSLTAGTSSVVRQVNSGLPRREQMEKAPFGQHNASKLMPTLQQGATYVLGRGYCLWQPSVEKQQVEKYVATKKALNRRGNLATHPISEESANVFWNVFDAFSVSLGEVSLSEGGQKILTVPNAGGSSIESEVMSFEIFHELFGARLLKTEMEVDYFPRGGSIADYLCEFNGRRVGVSVTRAMKFDGTFSDSDAEALLYKKLVGLQYARRNVMKRDRWDLSCLHIFCTSTRIAKTVRKVYFALDPEISGNVMLYLTVSNARWLYTTNAIGSI